MQLLGPYCRKKRIGATGVGSQSCQADRDENYESDLRGPEESVPYIKPFNEGPHYLTLHFLKSIKEL